MKKVRFLKRKSIMKFTSILTVLLVVLILISGTSISITLNKKSTNKNYNFIAQVEKISNGLAPMNKLKQVQPNLKSITFDETNPIDDCFTMYGYCAYDPSGQLEEGTVYFDICDPGTIEQIAQSESNNFISGGTCIHNLDLWIGCENSSGALWEIDIHTGEMIYIGGGGVSLNSLAYNPIDNKMYGSGDDDYLYEIDPDTGEQEQIGPFGNGVQYMIGMAFSSEGILYGWDLGSDKLWVIEQYTGEAEEIGPLGIDLNYAQDGDFHRDTDTLYLTAYTTTGQLYKCDEETGVCTMIGNFQGGAEITGSLFDQCFWGLEHDVALKSIDYPETGPATPDMRMQITVKNEGNNTETFDAQMEIYENQTVSTLIDENFSGPFPPEGWDTNTWVKCNCSPDNPAACLLKENHEQNHSSYITSKAVDASEYKACALRFRLAWDCLPHYCSIYIRFRLNESSPWKDVTPWDNPIHEQQEGELYEIGIYNCTEGCGDALQFQWDVIGYYFNIICLDDVTLEALDNYLEYAELVEDITLYPGEKKQIEFPSWTPSIWQDPEYENTWEDYLVHAFVICEGDHNPRNDYKYKPIDLYFGFFHDVGCKKVIGPESGPALTFPVNAVIRNFGQYDECCFKTYVEISELDILNCEKLLIEDFTDSTFPPPRWTKTHDNWKYSTTNYSGGILGEAKFYYLPIEKDIFRLNTPMIDTSEYNVIEIEFKHYVDHYNSTYNLQLESSADGITWDVLWQIRPTGDTGPEEISLLTEKNIGKDIYLSWTFDGNSNNLNNWYIDDIVIKGYTALEPEYEDDVCISTIDPGEELELLFEYWTPEYLVEEITDKKTYIVKAWTNMEEPEDKNQANNLFKNLITLDFFHDVKIKNITSPSSPYKRYTKSKTLPPMPGIYIQPGTEDIDVIVENNGTFPEFDLTCHAQIWDYITNGNGSLVYEDEITDIDLEEPNGGTKLLNFDDFTFVEEGVYRLFIDLPHEIDDYPKNNEKSLIIGVDDSNPFSWIEEIDPPEPNGNNGWYTSDVEVTICAEDPEIQEGIPGSGVCGIIVIYNCGNEQIFYDDCITIILDEENSYLEFYAVDCAGNKETPKHLEIKIDQTSPEIILSHEIVGGNKLQGWDFEFTATATDALSGMDYVEFYLGDILQKTIIGPGPEYKWTFRHPDGKNIIIKSIAYDKAGNFDYDEIKDPKVSSCSTPFNNQICNSKSRILKIPHMK